MLSEYVMTSRNAFKKRLIHLFIGKYLLRNSKLVSTSNLEKCECESIIPGADVANIFNIIRLPQLLYERTKNDVFKIGFISRIHDKKGLDLLIKALCKVSFPYRLFVAGEGEKEYLDFLKDLAIDCGNSEQIEWVGWKNGEEKFEFLSQLDLFALTSRNENFALVVAEALSVGTPVLVSGAVGLHDYITENDLGWVCSLEEENIVETLESIYNAKEKIKTINRRSPKIIRVDFEGSQIANRYTELYRSIISPLQIQS